MGDPVYKAIHNCDGFYSVNGPNRDGLGYHAHTLNPGLSCDSKEEAERAAKIAGIAYEAGYLRAQFDIRKSLGLNKK
jgi:hypothetical protein